MTWFNLSQYNSMIRQILANQHITQLLLQSQETTMNTKLVYSIPQTLTPKGRIIRIPENDRDAFYSKIAANHADIMRKDSSPVKDILKKQPQSTKNLYVDVKNSLGSEIYETNQQKYQRELARVKNYYENQIKNLASTHMKNYQQLQAKCRGLERQKNQWRETAMKMRNQFQSKVTNLQSNLKPNIPIKMHQSTIYQQENNSSRANKAVQEQLAKLRTMSFQTGAQISRLRDENKNLKCQIQKLQQRIRQISQIRSTSPMNIQNNRQLPSPVKKQREHRSSQSPRKSHSTHSTSSSHSIHHHKETPHGSSDPHKQIERLRKICGKMERIILQRNEQLMKQKTKVLNYKYMRV